MALYDFVKSLTKSSLLAHLKNVDQKTMKWRKDLLDAVVTKDELEDWSGGGGIDHGELGGLTHDDHTQYLLAAGTRSLTADWDAGGYEIRAKTLESDIATGTAPLTIASTTVVTNLNVDMVDGYHASSFATSDHNHDDDYISILDDAIAGNFASLTHGGEISDSGYDASDFALYEHNQIASTILIPDGVGSPAYDDVQDWFQETRSAGRITGGVVTAHAPADGTVDISAMEAMVFTTNALGGDFIYCKWPAQAGLAVDDGYVSWIYADYNGGSPDFKETVTRSDIHEYDQFSVGRVYRSGTDVEVQATGHSLYNKDRRSHNRLILKYGNMDHQDGAILGDAGSRKILVTLGTWWVANTQYTTAEVDTSGAGHFHSFYRSGASTWTKSGVLTQIPNTQYNRLSDNSLQDLTANRYGVYWIFIDPPGDVYAVYGQGDYTLAQAVSAAVPASLPPECVNWSTLIGKIVIQKSSATFYSVESVFTTTFNVSAATDHGDLAGLSDDDHTQYILAAGTRALTGDWDAGTYEIRANTFESDVATGTSPFTIASTTLNTNLNADLLDGNHAAAFSKISGTPEDNQIAAWTAADTIEGLTGVTSTNIVTYAGGAAVGNLANINPNIIGPPYFSIEDSGVASSSLATVMSPTLKMTVKNKSSGNMSALDLVYVSGIDSGVPKVELADADAAVSSSGMLLILAENISKVSSGSGIFFGYVSGLSGLTAGAIQYIHTTAGDLTESAPSASGDIVRVVGYAISTTEMMMIPDGTWIELV